MDADCSYGMHHVYRMREKGSGPERCGAGKDSGTGGTICTGIEGTGKGLSLIHILTSKPSTYTPSSHTHDDRYYTESETNSLLSGYIPKNGGGIITGTLQVSGGVKANGTYVVQGSTASQIRLNWTGSLMQVFVDNTLIGSIMFK